MRCCQESDRRNIAASFSAAKKSNDSRKEPKVKATALKQARLSEALLEILNLKKEGTFKIHKRNPHFYLFPSPTSSIFSKLH
jgi:hypothetical protein